MQNYLVACCDCGLVHRFNFRVLKIKGKHKDGRVPAELVSKHIVQYRVQLAPRYTKKMRAKMKGKS